MCLLPLPKLQLASLQLLLPPCDGSLNSFNVVLHAILFCAFESFFQAVNLILDGLLRPCFVEVAANKAVGRLLKCSPIIVPYHSGTIRLPLVESFARLLLWLGDDLGTLCLPLSLRWRRRLVLVAGF